MNIALYIILIIITFTFYMLEISFRSFSRVSLAGFINDQQKKRNFNPELVNNYEMILNSLQSFSFFLQLSMFIFSYFLFVKYFDNQLIFIALLIFLFIIIFDFFIYMIAFFNKEFILEKFFPLHRLPTFFFFPTNFVFSIFLKKRSIHPFAHGDDLSEKELEVFIEEGRKEGVIEKEDTEMIESVLEFGDTLVKEIMTPRVDMIYIDSSSNIANLISLIKKHKKSRYPVISDRVDNVIGIILYKDIFNFWNKKNFEISKLLRKPFFIPETMRILELLKELQRSSQKFAVVVDEFGGVSGVVTMEDIIEEIVGEIQDEYDEDIEQIVKEKDYFLVNGDTDVYELGDVMGIEIAEDEDFQTVSGLVSFKLGKIPRKNEKIVIYDHVFQVTEIEKNRILKVKIYREKKNNSGYVALIGRTNAGKSTFLNAIMDTKVSIVSDKPQTTRKQILGIHTTSKGQIVFFDSPGIHKPEYRLNQRMMKDVHNSLMDADIILYFVDIRDRDEDNFIISLLEKKENVFLVINKIDKSPKERALTKMDSMKDIYPWKEIIPISALKKLNIDLLEELIYRYLPESDILFYDEEEFTVQSEKFYISELIREKILNQTRDELPYTTFVKTDEIKDRGETTYVRATVYVDKHSQKKIVIGKKGMMIKKIGEDARKEIEEYYETKVFLDLYVKIVPNWRNSPFVLQDLFD